MVLKDDKKKRELRSHIGIFYFQEADQVQFIVLVVSYEYKCFYQSNCWDPNNNVRHRKKMSFQMIRLVGSNLAKLSKPLYCKTESSQIMLIIILNCRNCVQLPPINNRWKLRRRLHVKGDVYKGQRFIFIYFLFQICLENLGLCLTTMKSNFQPLVRLPVGNVITFPNFINFGQYVITDRQDENKTQTPIK